MSTDAALEPITIHRFGNPDAPPLVLVHGLTDDGTNWPDAVMRWAFHWDIHSLDQRGHGRSPRFTPSDVTRSHQIWVHDLVGVLQGIGRPAAVVGHSLGGLVALRAALEVPDLVSSLVLEDPARPQPGDGPDPAFVAGQQEFLAQFPERTAEEVERMHRETLWTNEEINAWALSKPLVDPLMIERGLFLGEPEWEGAFARLQVPTLLVLPGDGGMGPDPANPGNPIVDRVEIPGAGHCVRRDRAAEFYAAVESFLARHRA